MEALSASYRLPPFTTAQPPSSYLILSLVTCLHNRHCGEGSKVKLTRMEKAVTFLKLPTFLIINVPELQFSFTFTPKIVTNPPFMFILFEFFQWNCSFRYKTLVLQHLSVFHWFLYLVLFCILFKRCYSVYNLDFVEENFSLLLRPLSGFMDVLEAGRGFLVISMAARPLTTMEEASVVMTGRLVFRLEILVTCWVRFLGVWIYLSMVDTCFLVVFFWFSRMPSFLTTRGRPFSTATCPTLTPPSSPAPFLKYTWVICTIRWWCFRMLVILPACMIETNHMSSLSYFKRFFIQ